MDIVIYIIYYVTLVIYFDLQINLSLCNIIICKPFDKLWFINHVISHLL